MSRPKTTRTIDRIANMRRLLTELQTRNLSRDDIVALLGVGQSAVWEYMRSLGALVEIIPSGSNVQRSYHLTASPEDIEAFLVSLTAPKPRKTRACRASRLAALMLDPARHIHVMPDDEAYPLKLHRGPVMPDPWALPRPFFRSVGAGACA